MRNNLFNKLSTFATNHPTTFRIVGGLLSGVVMGTGLYMFECCCKANDVGCINRTFAKWGKEYPEEMKALNDAIASKKKEESDNE